MPNGYQEPKDLSSNNTVSKVYTTYKHHLPIHYISRLTNLKVSVRRISVAQSHAKRSCAAHHPLRQCATHLRHARPPLPTVPPQTCKKLSTEQNSSRSRHTPSDHTVLVMFENLRSSSSAVTSAPDPSPSSSEPPNPDTLRSPESHKRAPYIPMTS